MVSDVGVFWDEVPLVIERQLTGPGGRRNWWEGLTMVNIQLCLKPDVVMCVVPLGKVCRIPATVWFCLKGFRQLSIKDDFPETEIAVWPLAPSQPSILLSRDGLTTPWAHPSFTQLMIEALERCFSGTARGCRWPLKINIRWWRAE